MDFFVYRVRQLDLTVGYCKICHWLH